MNFIFVTREGYKDVGGRTRCYKFSERLLKNGIYSKVFSLVDSLGAKSGREEINFNWRDKLKLIYKSYNILLKEDDVSLFIVNRFNYHVLPIWFLSFKKNIPFVFDMDDWEARENLGYSLGIIPKSKAEYLTAQFAKRSKYCIAASRYLENYLLQFNKRVYYLPTGVDTGFFVPTAYKKKKEIVFSWHGSVNRVEILNYIKLIIDCFLLLYKKYPDIKLFIRGDGIFGEQLVSLIKGYNCKDIKHYGWTDYENISDYLDDIDVGLIPLLDRTHFNLSKSPVKLFEYMAKAKGVIASPVGEAGFVIKDGYNGFLALNKEEFIFGMEKLINNQDLLRRLGMNASKTVKEKYSLAVIEEKFHNIIVENL